MKARAGILIIITIIINNNNALGCKAKCQKRRDAEMMADKGAPLAAVTAPALPDPARSCPAYHAPLRCLPSSS